MSLLLLPALVLEGVTVTYNLGEGKGDAPDREAEKPNTDHTVGVEKIVMLNQICSFD